MQTRPVQAVQEWGEAFMTSMTNALALFRSTIPRDRQHTPQHGLRRLRRCGCPGGRLSIRTRGRDVAGCIWQGWYAQTQKAGLKKARAADAARDQRERQWDRPTTRVAWRADESPRM